MRKKATFIEGQKVGRLTLLVGGIKRGNSIYWKCKCDCGKEKDIRQGHMLAGKISSCGCFHKEQTSKASKTHGMSKMGFYIIWQKMLNRCTNKNDRRYKDWGGRGIKIEWKDFLEFKRDMYDKYLEHVAEFGAGRQTSIDRIDNDGNYCKENCRWATPKEQNNNQRKRK